MIVYGSDLDKNINTTRAGVIPFTVRKHRIHFLLGIDRQTRELTDFGGGVKSFETVVEGAAREFEEESCQLFSDMNIKRELYRSPVVTNKKGDAAIFFLRVDQNWLDIAEEKFNQYQDQLRIHRKYQELIGVKWVAQEDFKQVAFTRKSQCMWRRVQNILRWNTTWNELRLVLVLGPELTNIIRESWAALMGQDSQIAVV